MTQWVVKHYLSGKLDKEAKPFFTKLGTLLAGRSPVASSEAVDREAIWSSVMFYNYVPVLVANSARVRPTSEMWAAGRGPFRKVLEENEVEAVLVLGKQLWDNMAPSDEHATTFEFQGAKKWVRNYRLHRQPERSLQRVVSTHINHPSGWGWKGEHWRPVVDYLLDEVGRQRGGEQRAVGW